MSISMIEAAAGAIMKRIDSLPEADRPYLIAIDGRCASGKTTLAAFLQERIQECDVVHMDHFFLQDAQRTKERLAEPGGNVDYERVEAEVIRPLRNGQEAEYRPYDCTAKALGKPRRIAPQRYVFIEGSYSAHPALWDYYDLKIFLTTDETQQMKRIRHRGGDAAASVFRDRWIPLEESYFQACRIRERCDMCFET